MAKREYVAEDVDFKGIESAFSAIDPPTLQLEEVLDRVRPKMLEHRKRGVTVQQLAQALGEKGIQVKVRELKHFIDRGELPGGRVQKGQRADTVPGDAGGGGGEAPAEAVGAAPQSGTG